MLLRVERYDGPRGGSYGAIAPGGLALWDPGRLPPPPPPRLMLILLALRARMILPTVPNEPRSVSMPGSSIAKTSFSSIPAVCSREACKRMVDRRSSLVRCSGSTLDICRIVMPKQMTTKPITRVIMEAAEALRPWKRTYKTWVRMSEDCEDERCLRWSLRWRKM